VAGGVDVVQLREKDMPAGQLFRLALELKEAIGGRAMLVVNDRVDVAIAASTDGVQLGEEGLPIGAARLILRYGMRVGRSVHSVEGAAEAESLGADFLVLGTIFPSRSHPGAAGAGTALVREARKRVRIPILAIGGVTVENAAACIEAGADGVAVISAILAAPDPKQAAAQLKTTLWQAWGRRAISQTATLWERKE
jgi:thiamine-phosphate pyrophosphorylase